MTALAPHIRLPRLNRAPLNRAIYKAAQAIGLTPPPPSETPEADTPDEETADKVAI